MGTMITLIVIAALVLFFVTIYNKLVTLRNRFKNARPYQTVHHTNLCKGIGA